MKFETKQFNIFGELLQLPLPKDQLPACERLASAVAKGKPLQVEISVKRKKKVANGKRGAVGHAARFSCGP